MPNRKAFRIKCLPILLWDLYIVDIVVHLEVNKNGTREGALTVLKLPYAVIRTSRIIERLKKCLQYESSLYYSLRYTTVY